MKPSNIILLIIFIVLAVILNFLPHINYNLPLHVDEWVHFQYSNHLSTNAPLYFGGEYKSLEAGFHYLLATLNSIGIPYTFMFVYFASIITILISLSVFILTRKLFNETAGVYAVLFIAMLQSSVMILGPVFFVPMAVGMFFIAMILYLIKINSKAWIILLASILIIHPPTAMAILVLINIEFILIKKNYLKNLASQLVAGLIALPLYLPVFLSKGVETINSLNFSVISSALFVPRELGYLITAIAIFGIYFSMNAREKEKRNYSIVAYVIALLAFIILFYQLKIEVFIPYRRALMYLFLILSIPFGLGCERIIHLAKNNKMRLMVVILLITLILSLSLSAKIESSKPIYKIINENEHQDLLFIKNYTQENHLENAVVLADPWKAEAITPIAETQVYARIPQGPNQEIEARNKQTQDFFTNKCKDISFLKENNISIIYGNCDKNIKELTQIRENVFVLDD